MTYVYWWDFFLLHCISFCSWSKMYSLMTTWALRIYQELFQLLPLWIFSNGHQIKQVNEKENHMIFILNWTICDAKLHMFTPTTVRCNAGPSSVTWIFTRDPTILAGMQDYSKGGLLAHTTAGWAGTPLGPARPKTVHCKRTQYEKNNCIIIHSLDWKTIRIILVWSGSIVTQIKLIFLESFCLQLQYWGQLTHMQTFKAFMRLWDVALSNYLPSIIFQLSDLC